MTGANCKTASPDRNPGRENVQQLYDTDMELSDYPEDLSDYSQGKYDVQAEQNEQVEQHTDAPVEQPLQAEQNLQADQLTLARQDTHKPRSEHDVWVEKSTGLSHQALAHSIEAFPDPVHEDTLLYQQSLPTPPGTQELGDRYQPLSSPIPTTPQAAATSSPPSLPSPTSVNGSFGRHLSTPKGARHKQAIQTPRQTGIPPYSASVVPLTPTSLRRSLRLKRAPAKFTGMESRSPSPEPSPASKPERKSKVVILKLDSGVLEQLQKRTMATAEKLSPPPQPKKRKHSPPQPEPLAIKKSRKRDDHDRDAKALGTDVVPQNEASFLLQPDEHVPDLLTGSNTGISDALMSTAKQLMTCALPRSKQQLQKPKPEPRGKPPAWSNERFALCESIANFKSYQSGAYIRDGLVYAYLYGDNPLERDLLDNSVVIARASGGMEPVDDKTRERRLAKDQKETNKTVALRNTMKAYNPVLLVTKDNNPLMPSRMPHRYCVLGHYKPTHIWMEKHQGKKIIRYRFERLNPQGEAAWYQPEGIEEIAPPGSLEPPVVQSCPTCRKSFQQIYLQGWVCVNGDCQAFWKLPSSLGGLQELDEDILVYDPRFLKQKIAWPGEHLQPPLGYKPMETSDQIRAEDLYTRAAWNGLVCSRCNGCVLRKSFLGWDCETPGCDFQVRVPRKIMSASAITDSGPAFALTDGYTPSRDVVHGKEIRISKPVYANNFRMNRFRFSVPNSYVVHNIANDRINKAKGGPNDIFEQLQLIDIGLRRRKIVSEKHKDPSYIRHMNQNFGMRYKFTGTGIDNSRSFEEAEAPAIRDVRTRLNWSIVQVIARHEDRPIEEVAAAWKPVEFNEELVLSYFEDQGIGFHDDGEPGVGPAIATLSLGDTGKMQVRMKATRYYGVSRAGIYDYEHPPIPGCLRYAERLARHDKILRDAPTKDKTAFFKRVASEMNLKQAKAAPPVVLEMTLGHGDEVFMVGAAIQTYYEHSVTHKGRMRFALTCRYIDPSSIDPKDMPPFKVGPDMGYYDGSILPCPRDAAGNPIPNGWKFEDDDNFDSTEEEEAEELLGDIEDFDVGNVYE